MHDGSRKAVLAALFANAGIAIAKFAGFAVTGSSSMLAEGIHSVADTSNQGLLLLGGAQAGRATTRLHQFGFSRARYFWSFVVALVLFSLGGAFAIYEGIEKLRHPHEIESAEWAIGILAVAVVLEFFSLRTAVREARAVKGRTGWWPFIRHSRSPELPVVLLEDLGAMVGLFLALGGVGLTLATDEPRWDAAGTLAIGVLLVVIAAILAVEMRSLLLGEAATVEQEQAIADALLADSAIEEVLELRTQHFGPDDLLVVAAIRMRSDLTTARLADALDAAEARIRAAVPGARAIYLAPDLELDVDPHAAPEPTPDG